jgi:SAM-dependent methyltransferase
LSPVAVSLEPVVSQDHQAARLDDLLARARRTGLFRADDIDLIEQLMFNQGTAPGGAWDALAHAHMELPTWFQQGLDPLSPAYAEQQMKLWRLVSGVERPYDAAVDEKEAPVKGVDAVRLPGFYMRRDAGAVLSASDHVLATGMMLKHSGLKPGDWALEYGAGYGQTALALARLGVNVDTVDISSTFCNFVQQQADFFQVPLRAHQGQFGLNPRPGQRYQLVWFYESFHHCLEFPGLLAHLTALLADGGQVMLAGEPMVEREYAAVPYPWGVRLHSEVVAVVRRFHWFELGFSEDFLYQLFTHAGFTIQRIPCEPSLFGRLYLCTRRPAELHLGQQWLPPVLQEGWHAAEPDGRWTRDRARLALDPAAQQGHIELDLANLLDGRQTVTVQSGEHRLRIVLGRGERRTVRLPASGQAWLQIETRTRRPGALRRWLRGDRRPLGVFVRRLRYNSQAQA